MDLTTIIFIYYYLLLYLFLYLCVILISCSFVEYFVSPVYYVIFGVNIFEIQKIHMFMFICYGTFLIAIIDFMFDESLIKNI
jgi:hypothetical protein